MANVTREMNERLTYLLQGQSVEYVSLDHPMHLTIKFQDGPRLQVGINATGEGDLSCSVVADADTDEEWIKHAESPAGPRAPAR